MRHFQSQVSVRIIVGFAAVALTLMFSLSISAQRRKPIPSTSPKPTADTGNLRSADQAQMEMSILMSSRSLNANLERERNKLAAQFTNDLEQLERLNTEGVVPLLSSKTPDYKDIAQMSAEVKARATRIKFYSPITLIDRTGQKIRYDFDDKQIGAMLSELSKGITKFVGNPVFRVSAPNDGDLRSQAAHELDGIIKLSDIITKTARKLSRALVASK